jgi:hypothetical protein
MDRDAGITSALLLLAAANRLRTAAFVLVTADRRLVAALESSL